MAQRPLAPGERFAGLAVVDRLGAGGMGQVYRARDEALERDVALKVIPLDDGGPAGAERRRRALRELEAAARVRHPGVVQVHAAGEAPGCVYLVLELVTGEGLDRRLARGPLAPADAAALVARLARATQALHDAQVLHRDLKPANVLLDEAGAPRLTDFGVARLLDPEAERLTRTQQAVGTPLYMAPEQLAGQGVDARADVYGLGAVLFECLTGAPPFEAPSLVLLAAAKTRAAPDPLALRPGLPARLAALCRAALDPDPARRPQSAGALADALDAWRARGADAPGADRGRRAVAAGAAAVGLAGLAAAVVAWGAGWGAPSGGDGSTPTGRLAPAAPAAAAGPGAAQAAPPKPGAAATAAGPRASRRLVVRRRVAVPSGLAPGGVRVAWLADGAQAAVWATDGPGFAIVDLQHGRARRYELVAPVAGAAPWTDGQVLVGLGDGLLLVLNPETGGTEIVAGGALAPQRRLLDDGAVGVLLLGWPERAGAQVGDATAGRLKSLALDPGDVFRASALGEGGRTLWLGGQDQAGGAVAVRLLRGEAGWEGARALRPGRGQISAIAPAPGGATVFLGMLRGSLRRFDLDAERDLGALTRPDWSATGIENAHVHGVQALGVLPGGEILASATENEVALWDLTRGGAFLAAWDVGPRARSTWGPAGLLAATPREVVWWAPEADPAAAQEVGPPGLALEVRARLPGSGDGLREARRVTAALDQALAVSWVHGTTQLDAWGLETGAVDARQLPGPIQRAVPGARGQVLVGLQGGEVVVVDARPGGLATVLPARSFGALAETGAPGGAPAGGLAAGPSQGGYVRLRGGGAAWLPRRGAPRAIRLAGGGLEALRPAADGGAAWLFGGYEGESGYLLRHRLAGEGPVEDRLVEGLPERVTALDVTPDETLAVAGLEDGRLFVLDLARGAVTGELLRPGPARDDPPRGHRGRVKAVRLVDGGRGALTFAGSPGEPAELLRWDVARRRLAAPPEALPGYLDGAAARDGLVLLGPRGVEHWTAPP